LNNELTSRKYQERPWMELIGVLGDETSHEKVFSNRRMIIGEFHVAIKK